jgi:hypothetical protein
MRLALHVSGVPETSVPVTNNPAARPAVTNNPAARPAVTNNPAARPVVTNNPAAANNPTSRIQQRPPMPGNPMGTGDQEGQ